MIFRNTVCVSIFVAFAVILGGVQNAISAAPSNDAIVQIHWLGKKSVSGDTNSVELMKIWNMPESAKLEAQTIDKLSRAPWRFLRGQTNKSASDLLKPLLRDLIDGESYIEVRQPSGSTNLASEMVLAIHLNDQRATLWDTNLSTVLESLTGIRPVRDGNRWSLKKHHWPNLIEMARADGWTVLGAAEDHNQLLNETLARIRRDHAPFASRATNYWLEANMDLPRLAEMTGTTGNVAAKLPQVSLEAFGEHDYVRTVGQLSFKNADFEKLEAWHIPTNLVDGKLSSFLAVRGLRPWLMSCESWSNLQAGPPPDQFYLWSYPGLPMETYFASPLPNASNTVSRLNDVVLREGGSWFRTNTLNFFKRSGSFNGIEWTGLPYIQPFLQSTEMIDGSFVFAGWFTPEPALVPLPAALLNEVQDRPDLVYFEWEQTGLQTDHWNSLIQISRFLTGKAQLPSHSASLDWLLALQSRLENSIAQTEITTISPHQLSFKRNSTIGLTAIELNLIADWLASPEFPRGFHTFLAPPPDDVPPPAGQH